MKNLVIFLALVALAAPAGAADGPGQSRSYSKEQRQRAVERCRANRGIDCDSDQGLSEWLPQERTRREAVQDGSRIRGGGAQGARSAGGRGGYSR